MYTKGMEVFGVEPVPTVKEIMLKIGNPRERLVQIFDLIKYVTHSLKSNLKGEVESMQTNTYLITTPNFEKVFYQSKSTQDVEKFVSNKEFYNTLLREHEDEEYNSA